MRIERVLVPVDGSVLAETAVSHAVGLARETGAMVYLVRAAEAHTLPGSDPIEAQLAVVKDAEDYLQQVKARLAEEGFWTVETAVWYGSPTFAIVEAARLRHADLIVMTTHGRSGLGRLIMGSVAESVLRATETPILLLRVPGAPLDGTRGVAAPVEAARTRGASAGRPPAQTHERRRDMKVKDLMTKRPITVAPDVPVLEARYLMVSERIRHLIVTEGADLVGIVTDRDIRLSLPSPAPSLSVWEMTYLLARLTVGQVMSRTVIQVGPDREAREAARLLLDHKIGALPVVDEGDVIGILTESDFVRAFVENAAVAALPR